MSGFWSNEMALALDAAREFLGATSPNPPVGAVGLDAQGNVLSTQAHTQAGLAHAEQAVIADCRTRGLIDQLHTLVVTLEPCNHIGKTPACTDTILSTPIKRVVIGAKDPNPKVKGGGASYLRSKGIEVIEGIELKKCEELIRSFSTWSKTGLPWVTLKEALNRQGSMIPPHGSKTFTSRDSLIEAHLLRKRADAILTGSGTVLADQPEFTVRNVADFPGKKRFLAVMDRRSRLVGHPWLMSAQSRGFNVVLFTGTVQEALRDLAKKGVLEVLVEAGPTLTGYFKEQNLCNELVTIRQGSTSSEPDRIENVYRNY